MRRPHEEGSEEQGTYPSTPQRMETEHVPDNVLENVEECGTPTLMELLKEKVKKNIANCRESMARQKQTLSFRDQFGNLPVGRGRGKFELKRGKQKMTATIETETPASSSPAREGPLLKNAFRALQSVAPDFRMTDNEEGPIGGATDEVGQPPVSGEVEQMPAMEVEVEQQSVREEATGNMEDKMEEDNPLRGATSGRGGGGVAVCMAAAAKTKRSAGEEGKSPISSKQAQKSKVPAKQPEGTTEVLVEAVVHNEPKEPKATKSTRGTFRNKSGGRGRLAKNLTVPMTTRASSRKQAEGGRGESQGMLPGTLSMQQEQQVPGNVPQKTLATTVTPGPTKKPPSKPQTMPLKRLATIVIKSGHHMKITPRREETKEKTPAKTLLRKRQETMMAKGHVTCDVKVQPSPTMEIWVLWEKSATSRRQSYSSENYPLLDWCKR